MPRLRLLGPFDVERDDGARLPVPASCAPLLAYLVCHRGTPADRNALAELLWADRPQARARRCLATALWRLRAVPGLDRLVETGTANRLSLDPAASVRIDVIEFERAMRDLLAAGSGADDACITDALNAVELYAGDPFRQIDADWALIERERLRNLLVEGLGQLARLYEARGAIDRMLPLAERLAAMEPLREDVHRLLMRGYVARGARAKAIAQYRVCQGELAEALGVEPMAETQALYDRLVARTDRRRAPDADARAREIARAVSRKIGAGRRTTQTLGAELDEALRLLARLAP